jgi:hypothetical protein
MDVIEVLVVVVLTGDGVFPEAALPDAAFLPSNAGRIEGRFSSVLVAPLASELRFDERDAEGIAFVLFGKSPDAMQMIGEEDDGRNLERARALAFFDGGSEAFSSERRGEDVDAIVGDESEEIGAAGTVKAAVVGHGFKISKKVVGSM